MKILVKIPLSSYSGYGRDGIGLVQALQRLGADVVVQPTTVEPPIPEDVAHVLTKELSAPFDLYINHVDPASLNCSPEAQRSSGLSMAWTMWEYSSLENLPKKHLKTLKKRLKRFDAFVGYSDIDMQSIDPYYKGAKFVCQGGYDPALWEPVERDWESKEFYFFMLGVLSERKDPFRAIEAFRMAKERDQEFDRYAKLSLKTISPGIHHKIEDLFRQIDPDTGEEYTSLRVFYDIWPTEVVQEFYKVQHVLLAPSRGEGKNVPALEFMTTGGTVIATNWAGHTQWLKEDFAYPLNYTLEPVNVDYPDVLNARADIEHLSDLMLHAFHNRDEVRSKGELAAREIPAKHSWDAVVRRLFAQLRDEVPEKGAALWEKYLELPGVQHEND